MDKDGTTESGRTERSVIVTGATRGIGEATALVLAQRGYSVLVNAHTSASEDRGEQIARRCRALGVDAFVHVADVGSSAQCDAMVDAAVARFGHVDGLVNNAGMSVFGSMLRMTDEQFDATIRTNASGVFYMMRAVANRMRVRRYGSIVNVSSVGGLYGSPMSIGYGAAKGAVLAMTKTAAKELARSGIRVNAVVPGGTRNDRYEQFGLPPERVADQMKLIALGRLAEPSEIASAIAFLVSDEASYVTGAFLEVSGGVMM